MGAVDIIRELRALGAEVTAVRGKLSVRPASLLDDRLREEIRADRDRIIFLLRTEEPWPPIDRRHPWFGSPSIPDVDDDSKWLLPPVLRDHAARQLLEDVRRREAEIEAVDGRLRVVGEIDGELRERLLEYKVELLALLADDVPF
jgi:hypothetical protein